MGAFRDIAEDVTRKRMDHQKWTIRSKDGPLGLYSNQGSASKVQPLLIDGILKMPKRGGWATVPGRWLRDICSCCRNRETGQKTVNVLKLSEKACRIVHAVDNAETASYSVEFGDGHHSVFPYSAFTNRTLLAASQWRDGLVPLTTWTADVANAPPSVPYDQVQSGMAVMLRSVREFGFVTIENVPATPEATEALLSSIGPIRNTHYGAFYDFTSDLSSKDTAYTNEALEPHTDNTYFTEPAGLQALHLLSHEDGCGGESILVDGFAAADQLYNEDVNAYQKLSLTGVYSHASGNDGISIQSAQPYPTFSHHPSARYLSQVRWNTADRAGLATTVYGMERWYTAAAKFDAIVSDTTKQYKFQLKPGTVLIMDNWRVLHGRSAFTGKRRMCGGYINRDDFISKFRMTNLSPEQIEASTYG
ncbi:hypothetical protein LTR08_008490 [Meristemomyces frigidus]|nr:hypothetical protein LTR08_008490 [Meristemomyces frigidus]